MIGKFQARCFDVSDLQKTSLVSDFAFHDVSLYSTWDLLPGKGDFGGGNFVRLKCRRLGQLRRSNPGDSSPRYIKTRRFDVEIEIRVYYAQDIGRSEKIVGPDYLYARVLGVNVGNIPFLETLILDAVDNIAPGGAGISRIVQSHITASG